MQVIWLLNHNPYRGNTGDGSVWWMVLTTFSFPHQNPFMSPPLSHLIGMNVSPRETPTKWDWNRTSGNWWKLKFPKWKWMNLPYLQTSDANRLELDFHQGHNLNRSKPLNHGGILNSEQIPYQTQIPRDFLPQVQWTLTESNFLSVNYWQ